LYSDQEIVNGCLSNNKFYQELLYKKYAPKMYGICLRYASDRDLANDMLQEGFIRVYNMLHTFKFQANLSSWMYQVFVSNSINYLRKYYKHKEDSLSENYDNREDVNVNEDEKMHWLNHVSKEEALLMIQELPDKYRLVINMYAIDNMSHAEISKIIGVTESSSRSQLSRARQLLSEKLKLKLKSTIERD
jgi:RNA polymerase sigma factor (sigma-70 family)